MKCPICGLNKKNDSFSIKTISSDKSYLYTDIKVVYCNNCGHVYNHLTKKEKENLKLFYVKEYPFIHKGDPKEKYSPGSLNKASRETYEILLSMFPNEINKDSYILDVGCSSGGFLKFLKEKGFRNLFGIDPSLEKDYQELNIVVGTSENIPFKKNTFDLVVTNHVLEHTLDPLKSVKEMNRVTKENGHILISVPNYYKYKHYFPYSYFLIKEHIHHFSILSLNKIASLTNLNYKKRVEFISDPDTNKFPSICVLYEKANFDLDMNVKQFIKNDKEVLTLSMLNSSIQTVKILKNFNSIVKNCDTVYCWGIGKEFFYLYEELNLKKYKVVLLDKDVNKQKKVTVNGLTINNPDVLKGFNKKSCLLITAVPYTKQILKSLKILNYKGKILKYE